MHDGQLLEKVSLRRLLPWKFCLYVLACVCVSFGFVVVFVVSSRKVASCEMSRNGNDPTNLLLGVVLANLGSAQVRGGLHTICDFENIVHLFDGINGSCRPRGALQNQRIWLQVAPEATVLAAIGSRMRGSGGLWFPGQAVLARRALPNRQF